MSLIGILANDNYIVVNKDLIKMIGLDAAVLLGELASEHVYWEKQEKLDEEGYFYSTIENIENNTSLSQYKQSEALNKLKKLGVVDVKRNGIPAKRFIKIFEYNMLGLFDSKLSKNLITGSQKTQEQETQKFDEKNNKNNNNKKNNKEYTSEFEIAWQEYPKKNGKEPARKAYLKARKEGVTQEQILDGIRRYKQYIEETNTADQYVKYGSTWFNQRCWEDQYKAVRKKPSNSFHNMSSREFDFDELERLAREKSFEKS